MCVDRSPKAKADKFDFEFWLSCISNSNNLYIQGSRSNIGVNNIQIKKRLPFLGLAIMRLINLHELFF